MSEATFISVEKVSDIENGYKVTFISRHIDHELAEGLVDQLKEIIGDQQCTILFNFQDVVYFASGLVSQLLRLKNRSRVILFGLNAHSREVFNRLNLNEVFEVVTDQEEALKICGGN